MKQNCWEYMNCGREPGGKNVKKYGICPAAKINHYEGVNKGDKAGRICWAISGTLCNKDVKGIYAKEIKSCMICPFLVDVRDEEKNGFRLMVPKINL